jgi:hypothetical protein
MQTVYIVEGLGFGDDENEWECCSVHSTRLGAEAKCASILADDSDLDVRVVEKYLQD